MGKMGEKLFQVAQLRNESKKRRKKKKKRKKRNPKKNEVYLNVMQETYKIRIDFRCLLVIFFFLWHIVTRNKT